MERAEQDFANDYSDIYNDPILLRNTNQRISQLRASGIDAVSAISQAGREIDAWLKSKTQLVSGSQEPTTREASKAVTKVGDMSDRKKRKRQTVVRLPSASQRHQSPPEKKIPTQSEHIAIMRKQRGLRA